MNKKLLLLGMLMCVVLIGGCTKAIEDVKDDKYLDKTVTVKGMVGNTLKMGDLISKYDIVDKEGDSITIESSSLNSVPREGTTQKITGTLKKVPVLNTYYIQVE